VVRLLAADFCQQVSKPAIVATGDFVVPFKLLAVHDTFLLRCARMLSRQPGPDAIRSYSAGRRFSLDQVIGVGVVSEVGVGCHLHLVHDARAIGTGRLDAQNQGHSDLADLLAPGQHHEDLHFPR